MEQLMSAECATNINSMPLLIPTLSSIFTLYAVSLSICDDEMKLRSPINHRDLMGKKTMT